MVESIVNPTGEVVDLPALAAVAKAHRLPLVVDNTLATPALLRPIEHGADIVFHSASKFMVGSGTAIGGVIVDAGRFDWAGDARFPLMSAHGRIMKASSSPTAIPIWPSRRRAGSSAYANSDRASRR